MTTSVRSLDYESAAAAAALPRETRLGAVHLTVRDLARSVPFYEEVVGLDAAWTGSTAGERPAVALGSAGDDPVLVLVEAPTAPSQGRHAGLYHVALRYPDRERLGHVVRRVAERRVPVQGASDHGTHEAIYLPDPDGNGLELETDRPRAAWPPIAEEFARGGPQPLDVDDLVATTAGQATEPRSAGVRVGHLHLHVASTDAAERFYADVLGMAAIVAMPTAVFLSAGGYHHHVGVNTWRGPGVPPVRPDAVGMRRWTVLVPGADDLAAAVARAESGRARHRVDEDGALVLADPSGNVVVVETPAISAAAGPGRERVAAA